MKRRYRNSWIYAVASAVALCLGLMRVTAAQNVYPDKPIAMLVGFSAGGPTDIVARLLAKGMSAVLHVPVIVENKPGAAGNIAAVQAKQAKPDGYTIFFAGANHTINVGMFPDLPYHPVEDFVPIAIVAEAPSVMVARPDFPADDAKTLFAQLRQNPGKYSIATAGGGQLQVLQFKQQTATVLVDVPYKGAAPAITDLAGGHVDLSLATLGSVLPQIKAGQIKALALAAPQRSRLLADIPTFEEAGYPGIYMGSWYGLLAPNTTPSTIVVRLAQALDAVATSPAFHASLENAGLVAVIGSTPASFLARVQQETRTYQKIGETLRNGQD